MISGNFMSDRQIRWIRMIALAMLLVLQPIMAVVANSGTYSEGARSQSGADREASRVVGAHRIGSTGIVRLRYANTDGSGGEEWLLNEATGSMRRANRGSFPPVTRLEQGVWLSTDWKTILKLSDIQKLSKGQGAVIALIDTGIDLNNANLSGMLWTNSGEIPGDGIDNDGNGYVDDVHGWSTGDGSNALQDSYGHGTALSSIIQEIAPDARIMVLKINEDGQGSFSEGALLEALLYAKNNGAAIVNLSLSIAASDELKSAIRQLWGIGAVIPAAAGNGGSTSSVEFPASMAETIAVGAMYTDTQVASWISPVGDALDVMAPGVAIPVAAIGGGQSVMSGTSFSTAMASAVLAVLHGMDPGLGRDGLYQALIHGVRDLGAAGKDTTYGYGAIDGEKLVAYVTQTVGETTGNHEYSVSLRTPLKLCVLATNSYGETPVHEWFALSAVAGGQVLSVYVFDGKSLVLAAAAADLTRNVYPYAAGQVNVIGTLSLADLGLSEGDTLAYAYAYSNENGEIRFPEVVTIQAK
ncbi:S8 family serine peptidase [Desulfatirhabdium butyrativorans]|uniref:S8 family serine peptidase n=1 Tax=Desulfatirhabdium butyrativorans TaxID=340467 RepID=UPI00041513CD|nr:S8 family serine peptidase [Desulfatirhabdium butyrativorans]